MAATTGFHKVSTPHGAQSVHYHPSENYVCPLTGKRLRRKLLGSCASGLLAVGTVVKSTGIDLFYWHRNGCQPGPGELDQALQRFLQECWNTMTRKPGRPQYHKVNDAGTYWLASMPVLGSYGVDRSAAGGCELFRLITPHRRPRG